MTCGRTTVLIVSSLLALSVDTTMARQQSATTRTPPPGSAQATPQTDRADSRAVAQGFSVVLVLADLQGAAAQDDVPPAARRALADMKDFLPYKTYKLLDAAWILGHGSSGTVTRLRGLEEREYELRMHTSTPSRGFTGGVPSATASSSAVFVRFTLSESSHREATEAEVATVLMERAAQANEAARQHQQDVLRLEMELRALQKERESGKADEARMRSLQAEIAAARDRVSGSRRITTRQPTKTVVTRRSGTIIDTSFTMAIGETVVVGTSRLKGNSSALIALLTAVPSRSSAR